MRVEGIHSFEPTIKLYPISRYKDYNKIPAVERIQPDLENSSRQIQKMDLFKYYGQKGIENLYPKGQHINITV